jgi:hypothetical protein
LLRRSTISYPHSSTFAYALALFTLHNFTYLSLLRSLQGCARTHQHGRHLPPQFLEAQSFYFDSSGSLHEACMKPDVGIRLICTVLLRTTLPTGTRMIRRVSTSKWRPLAQAATHLSPLLLRAGTFEDVCRESHLHYSDGILPGQCLRTAAPRLPTTFWNGHIRPSFPRSGLL